MTTFTIAKFDGTTYGERYCPYDAPENQLADDLADAREKAIFVFEDAGTSCRAVGERDFVTADGDEYRVFLR